MSLPSSSPPPPPLSSHSGSFSSSTHCREWLYSSPAALEAARRRSQVKTKERLERLKRLKERKEQEKQKEQKGNTETMVDISSSVPPVSDAAAAAAASAVSGSSSKKSKDDPANTEPLTLNEERQLRLHYVLQLNQMAQILRLPTHVTHAAIIFFQRFFLHQSVMEYSPKDVAYCCIYLACKSEEHHLPLERMIHEITKSAGGGGGKDAATTSGAPPPTTTTTAVAATGTKPSSAFSTSSKIVTTVLSLEVPVLSELKFQLRLYHLARSIRGIIEILKEMEPIGSSAGVHINMNEPSLTLKGDPNTILTSVGNYLQTRSGRLSDMALYTDAMFLHSPSQIALACLVQAESELRQYGIDVDLSGGTGSCIMTPVASSKIVDKFIAKQAVPTSSSSSSSSLTSLETDPRLLNLLQTKLDSVHNLLESGRESIVRMDKKVLKLIEKRRKILTNPILDPNSKEAIEAKIQSEEEKERKREAKKRSEREALLKKEDAFLMDLTTTTTKNNNVDGEVPGGDEFQLHTKRQKGLDGTPSKRSSSLFDHMEDEVEMATKPPMPADTTSETRTLQFDDAAME